MISIKKFLEDTSARRDPAPIWDEKVLLDLALAAYRSSLLEMGECSEDACPSVGDELKDGLGKLTENLFPGISPETLKGAEARVRELLQNWGGRAATHYREKAAEVKEILLVMAHAAESVVARDVRCAAQINEVTTRLKTIADLDDLPQIRASIEKSAVELKTSIARMTEEGKAAITQLQKEVASFQVKLEEAEHMASCDRLTGLRNRHSVVGHIEAMMSASVPFCVAVFDIDGFKSVNDTYGHIVGDELLQMFAAELRTRCRTTDVVGRWGGDEFVILLDCEISEAIGQTERVKEWVCGNYTAHGTAGPVKLGVATSVGVAEYIHGETLNELFARADAEMYRSKAASRQALVGAGVKSGHARMRP